MYPRRSLACLWCATPHIWTFTTLASSITTPSVKKERRKRTAKPVSVPQILSRQSVLVRGRRVTVVDSAASARIAMDQLLRLPPEAVVAWNIETTDVDVKRFHTAGTGGRVLCASFTLPDGDTVFVDAMPLTSLEEDEDLPQTSEILDIFKEYFEDSCRLKASHTIADDYHVLLCHGIRLRGIESDTRYLARLANTSLSSWEGVASKKSAAEESIESESADEVSDTGYDLRGSAFSLVQGIPKLEYNDKKRERFIARLNGSKLAHFSGSTMRDYWIGRVCESSVLTQDLHSALKSRLHETEWTSAVVPGKILNMWDMFCTVHRKLIPLLAEVEHTGICLKKPFLDEVREKTKNLVSTHSAGFVAACMRMQDPSRPGHLLNPDASFINPHSPQHVRQLLFGCPSEKQSDWFSYGKKTEGKRVPQAMNFPRPDEGEFEIRGIGLRPIKSKMNKKRLSDYSQKGLPSVNQKLLNEYCGKEPEHGLFGRASDKDQLGKFGSEYVKQSSLLMFHLSNVSKYQYVLGSFIDPLLDKVVEGRDGNFRIHPSLSLDTSTGRLACRKPNLHNPPNASDTLGLRGAFIAAPGNSLVVADYSQLELRILAHVTQCESMIKSLNAGGDYHSWTAYDMFAHVRIAVNGGECTIVDDGNNTPTVKHVFSQERSRAKAVNFSIAYGKCARSIAEDLDIELNEAEELLLKWYESKPEVAAWKQDTVFAARVHKRVESILGRRRDIPHIDKPLWKGRSERAAVNHCIQGSAADIAICAMIRIGSDLRLAEMGFKLLMQIHDEFIIEGPTENTDEAKAILSEIMRNPFADLNPDYKFSVPLEVDAGIGPDWLTAKP